MAEVLISVRGLKTNFYTYAGVVKALDGIDLDIYKGETIGLVGETGCGKSVTALSIIRLIQWPPGRIDEGSVTFNGKDLLKLPPHEMRKIRGNKISMIFQEPMNAFNPVYSIGDQIAEVIRLHQKKSKKEAWHQAVEMLKFTGVPAPERVAKSYPHELSGGMLQRAMISMALACQPALLIADEPTTALDVTIEAQILDLMRGLKSRTGASILLITHDMGIIAQMCDRVGIMYAGNIVELADVETIFHKPSHPYTNGLICAIPTTSSKHDCRLETIPGNVPNLIKPPTGCRFHPRCAKAMDICRKEKPGVYKLGEGHYVSCFLFAEGVKK
jgi:oligopeptide/dipeptide ABC transporter ATP-binding protein